MTTKNYTSDVVIIGSGVAGSLIAYKLASSGIKVLVLEAGPRLTREQIFNSFLNIDMGMDLSAPYPNTHLAPRPGGQSSDPVVHLQNGPTPFHCDYLRLVGGTTWHWGAVSMRFLERDFLIKHSFGLGKDWPISYSELEPYYCEAEDHLSVSGHTESLWNGPRSKSYPLPSQNMSYLDAYVKTQATQIGMDFTQLPVARNSKSRDGRPACLGYGNCVPICPTGAQYAAITHVEKAEEAGAKVIENALVTSININKEQNIKSLSVKRLDGSSETVHAKIFIVAANAIETPRLLLLSASENCPYGVANSSGLVGCNLMAHLGFDTKMLIKKPVYPGRGPQTGIAYQEHRDGEHRRKYAAYYLQVSNSANVKGHTAQLIENGYKGEDLDRNIVDRVSRELTIFARSEQLPSKDNCLKLDYNHKDTSGLPKVRFSYQVDDYTKKGLDQARKKIELLAKHLGGSNIDYYGEKSSSHPMGTACMGKDSRHSVVDSECRTHDHRNLFIAGSAVFPTGGTATPTLTISALSLRVADVIQKQLTNSL